MVRTRLDGNRLHSIRPRRVRPGGRAACRSACESLESRQLLAALPAGVALDTTFGNSGIADLPLLAGHGGDVALDASGKLLVAGKVQNTAALLRLNPDGSPDPTFNNGVPAMLEPPPQRSPAGWHAVLPLGDGGILVGGEQTRLRTDGTYEIRPVVARYNPDGSRDRAFGGDEATDGVVLLPGGAYSSLMMDLALLPSGQVLAAGAVREQISDYDYALWRLNADGTPDATFGGNGFRKHSVAAGDILLSAIPLPGGAFVSATSHGAMAFNADGSIRGIVGNPEGKAVDVTPDNKIVVASVTSDGAVSNTVYTTTVRRFFADGTPDLTFGDNPDGSTTLAVGAKGDYAHSVTALADGSVLVAANSFDAGNAHHPTVVRLGPGGSPDRAFGVDGVMTDPVTFGPDEVIPGPDGRLYTSGYMGVDQWVLVAHQLNPGIVADPGGPYGPVDEGATFQASASGSYEHGRIVKYEWDTEFNGFDFRPDGEGQTATLRAPDDNPPRRLALRVTTDDGLQAIAPATAEVHWRNAPPAVTQLVADPGAFVFGLGGALYGLVQDPGGDAATVRIDWGDGTAPADATVDRGIFMASHTYAARGTYTVRITATDDEGASSTREHTLLAADVIGNVFHDRRDDGLLVTPTMGTDPGMPGITVYVDADADGTLDDGETRTVTDDRGYYAFLSLGDGTHAIRVVPPAGWRVTNPESALTPVTVGGATGSRRDFGLSDRARITGVVFDDANADGARDAGEAAMRGVALRNVYLDLNNNGWYDADEPKAPPVPPSADQYVLADLLPGTYTVRYQPGLTPGGAGANGAAQTFPNERGGQTGYTVTVGAGQVSSGNDFGSFFGNTTITGVVYLDRNRDGDRDAAIGEEPALADRVVYLDHDGDGALDPDESRSRTPDPRFGNGSYFLPVVRGRTYTVRTVLPAGSAQSQPAGGNGTPYVITVEQNNTAALQNRDFGTYVVTPAVVGRHLFYYRGLIGNNNEPADPRNDNAIAPDKTALLPGQTGGFANVSSYTRGLNGVMVDLNDLTRAGSPSVLQFAVGDGTSQAPGAWTPINPSRNVEIRRGAGVGGSDRLVAVFDDNAIQNKWLRVTVLPGTESGLSGPDVFYFGHLAGETGAGDPLKVNALDVAALKRNLTTGTVGVGNPYDLNRDLRVNASDLAALKANLTRSLAAFVPPAAPTTSSPAPSATAWLARPA